MEKKDRCKKSPDRTRCGIAETGSAAAQKRGASEVIEAIAEARSHGDLSKTPNTKPQKNAKALSRPHFRAGTQTFRCPHHQIRPKSTPEGKIVFSTTVTLEDLETEEHITYQIVGEDKPTSNRAKSMSAHRLPAP